ncbi:D-threonine aldolase [bacterium HR17]|uniref:D-threonine aldolase n=1 Tax=Candidatus Fervidibacter japonicus TaxID=2035412 RepID=A0A2H5XFG9_9BACT|nr:D-threonine aldolase [bacterium HR17]
MTWRDTERCVGRSIFDESVPTPFVFIDRAILQRNIAHMQALAQTAGVGLRPHTKTHKIAAIAQMQLQAGACGLTVAKLGEAAAFTDAGIRASFMVAQPFVGAEKVRWALRMAETCEMLLCLDSVELAAAMGDIAVRDGKQVDIVLIVDTDYKRFGVDWRQAPRVAEQIARLNGVHFRGIRSHDGRTYRMPTMEERMQVAKEEAERMAEAANQIRQRGVDCDLVSIGSTPGAYFALQNGWTDGITEVRPGNYVFHDRMQISLGVARPDDCALRVVASVVSTPREGEALIDAGLKTLTGTLDRFSEGYGLVVAYTVKGNTHRLVKSSGWSGDQPSKTPQMVIERLWEECGLIRCEGESLRVGDRLVIVPNHACEITNLAEIVFYGTNDRIEGFWVAEARGKVW